MFRHLIGDLIALEHVSEHIDLEPEALGHPDEHHDLVAPVRVGVDPNPPLHDVDQRF